MSNQWGRDTQHNQRSSGGSAGLVIAVLVSLLLGAGGGFGYGWWRNSQLAPPQDSQTMIADLEAQLQASKANLAILKAEAAEREAQLTAKVSGLEDEIASLKSGGLQSARDLADMAALRAKVESLQGALNSSQDTIGDLQAQLAARPGDDVTAGLRKQIEDLTRINTKLGEDFQALQDDSFKAVAEKQNALDEMRGKQLEPLKKQKDALENSNSRLLQQLQKLQAEQTRLSAELMSARAELAGLKASSQTAVSPAAQSATQAVHMQGRSAGEVGAALATTPGLENLADDKRQDLTMRLEKGECVTTALQAVFKRVPVLALSHLLRALPGGC